MSGAQLFHKHPRTVLGATDQDFCPEGVFGVGESRRGWRPRKEQREEIIRGSPFLEPTLRRGARFVDTQRGQGSGNAPVSH